MLLAFLLSFVTIGLADPALVQQPMSSGQANWTASFSIDERPQEIVVSISISLLVPGDVRRPLLDRKITDWKAAIDSTWNDRFYIHAGQSQVPIEFKVKFTHFQPHHRVVIHPGSWVVNQHNWYIDTPASVIAHEVGHMLGAYDEYHGGSLSPGNPLVDSSSIMGGNPSFGVAYPRHLSLLKQKLVEHFDSDQIEISVY